MRWRLFLLFPLVLTSPIYAGISVVVYPQPICVLFGLISVFWALLLTSIAQEDGIRMERNRHPVREEGEL